MPSPQSAVLAALVLAVARTAIASKTNSVCARFSDRVEMYTPGAPGKRSTGEWLKIGSPAGAIYGGEAGLLATTPSNDKLYYWAHDEQWLEIGNGGSTYAQTENQIYGLTKNLGAIYRHKKGKEWVQVGKSASTIIAGGGDIYYVDKGNTAIYRAKGKDGEWEKIGRGGTKFVIDGDGTLYALNTGKDSVFKYTGTGEDWEQIGGPANDIWAGGLGLVATNPGNTESWKYGGKGNHWFRIGDGGKEFAVNDEGIYSVDTSGTKVSRWSGLGLDWVLLKKDASPLQLVPCVSPEDIPDSVCGASCRSSADCLLVPGSNVCYCDSQLWICRLRRS